MAACSPPAPDVPEHDLAHVKPRGVTSRGHDVTQPYDWNADAIACYTLALRMIALRLGTRRFETIPEMYWQERHGVIP